MIFYGGGRKGKILNLNRVTRVRPFRRKGLNLNYKSEDVKECFIVFLEEKGKYIREFVMRFLGFPYSVSYRVEEKVALERQHSCSHSICVKYLYIVVFLIDLMPLYLNFRFINSFQNRRTFFRLNFLLGDIFVKLFY